MSQFRRRFQNLTRDQELFIEIIDRLDLNLSAISGLALEVTAESINLNTDTLEASNDAIQVAVESVDTKLITDTDDNAIAESQVLPLVISELYGYWDGAWQRVGTDGNNNLAVVDANSTPKSNKYKLENQANDLVQTFDYADAGTADERVTSIVYSSVALALTVTETFAYAGGAGTYRVSTITLS